ncbi:hypothetical protein HanXRQr2_Chr03g0128171 [Helianthus annuus]|uniref:Uncharacterized protein n=1 Tax=Helianthus annuus TaxID=4232 RepID=A0A9K3JJN3_HELAN|nr:structural maintenance of chromosomes protein 4-like [Helianthus annuus]XP_022029474.1 structural maintenance of chromosomes protein 4-like [Helianthus annuus]KAF5815892.1 hypothetical protein HanXRQr2_Chr03g0128171 [Helianthus annuus]KAJ0945161.1 hypothetical protein HanPSC8_Chr03g0124941 [Helianthus annuus]
MVALLEAHKKEMNPNLDSIADYRNKVSIYNERVEELNVVTNERDDTKKQYDEWRKRRLDEFMAGFNTISLKLKEMYQVLNHSSWLKTVVSNHSSLRNNWKNDVDKLNFLHRLNFKFCPISIYLISSGVLYL